jgi:hypothetical protein
MREGKTERKTWRQTATVRQEQREGNGQDYRKLNRWVEAKARAENASCINSSLNNEPP